MLKIKQQNCRIVATESKQRSMKVGTGLWTNKTKLKGHSKINDHIKRNLYA